MYKLILIALFLILGGCANKAYNLKFYDEKGFIKNTQSLSEELIIKKGMITTLKFDAPVDYFILGDDLVADARKIDNTTIMVSAKLAEDVTNINVSTADRTFVFVVKTIDYNSLETPILHVNIGKDTKLSKALPLPKDNPNFDYKFSMYVKRCGWFKNCADYKDIAPTKIWTDGTFTYLDFNSSKGQSRDITQVMDVQDKIDYQVNYTIKDNIIVIHTVSKMLVIKAGEKYICIEYKGKKYDTR